MQEQLKINNAKAVVLHSDDDKLAYIYDKDSNAQIANFEDVISLIKALKDLKPYNKMPTLKGIHLSGFDKDGKITICGKATDAGNNEPNKALMSFIKNNYVIAGGLFDDKRLNELLDNGDISIDEFKKRWVEQTNIIKKELEASAQKFKKELETENKPFKPIEAKSKSETYKDEAIDELKKLYEFIKREFDNGKKIFEIVQNLETNRVNKLV